MKGDAGQAQAECGIAVEMTIPVVRRGRKAGSAEVKEVAQGPPPGPKIPRITRLMALAIKFQDMIDRGEVRDYADLARLGLVTRARLTQIMNLTLLAPDIQEAILFSEQAIPAGLQLSERDLRSVSKLIDWRDQRKRFRAVIECLRLTKRRAIAGCRFASIGTGDPDAPPTSGSVYR
ncbi:MAG: hypothetical protein M9913_16895 [Bryobacteraceae bacterium]|nr:hypothetical protein [Solibacteraceae bacterium]MCO5352544.1 hypothetical protein [Bryobacteraceae bacterium]